MNGIKLSSETEKCRQFLYDYISASPPFAIAFSGGIDSSILLESATRSANHTFLAVIVKTGLSPYDEFESAVAYLKNSGVEYAVIEADPLSEKSVSSNPPDRCYHCKKFIFSRIIDAAAARGILTVFDGTHHDDLSDYRPGLKALAELGVMSPLKESVFRKKNIRELAHFYSLRNSGTEASPCLATRIPYGTEIMEGDLRRIEKGESFLKNAGFSSVRLRLHGNIARIEVAVEQFSRFSDPELRREITSYIRSLGFNFVTLDLEGYRTGSMNTHLLPEGEIG